jgi:hypothetical protein
VARPQRPARSASISARAFGTVGLLAAAVAGRLMLRECTASMRAEKQPHPGNAFPSARVRRLKNAVQVFMRRFPSGQTVRFAHLLL